MTQEKISTYLRLINSLGLTRHPGGLDLTDNLYKRAGLKKKSRVLDMGCGAGHTSAHIAQKYSCSVTGIDICLKALESAQGLYEKKIKNKILNFEQGDILNINYSDNYFDLVLCESVLIFVKDKKKALQELTRVIKPGGFLILNEICAENAKNLKIQKEYLGQKEFGAYAQEYKKLREILVEQKIDFVVEDMGKLDLITQLKADTKQFLNFRGVLQLLELFFMGFKKRQFRLDILELTKFVLQAPKDVWQSFYRYTILGQKNKKL